VIRSGRRFKSLDLSAGEEEAAGEEGHALEVQRNDIDKVEKEYKQFLYLIATNPGKTVVPWSEPLDDLWHEHILDTHKYTEECKKIFGQYVHHNPHLDRGTAAQKTAYKETQEMYKTAFGKKAKPRRRRVAGGPTTTPSHPGVAG
jgi:hypothetical protein